MEHGDEGLRMLDAYIDVDDIQTQKAYVAGIKIVCKGIAIGLFDASQ